MDLARPWRPRLSLWLLLLGLGLALAAPAVGAVDREAVYTATVAVEGRSAAARERAAEQGLERVLGRMTGAYEDLGDSPAAALLERPERYLAGYRYQRGDEGQGLRIELRFDDAALRQALGERQVPVWGSYRPPVLAWLAVERGGERRLLGADDTGDRVYNRFQRLAAERALPLSLPLLDLQDRRALGFIDIWGGFDEVVREASARYDPSTVLALALRRDGDGRWRGRWHLLLGEEGHAYRSGPGGLEAVMRRGLDEVGRALVRRYAVVPGSHSGEYLRIEVRGLEAATDYVELVRELEGVRGVEGAGVLRASGRRAELRLELGRSRERVLGGLNALQRLELEPPPAEAQGGEGRQARAYRWRG